MALKIQFGEKSLPLEVRNYISENTPGLPRAYIIGLKAISDHAFRDDPEDNIVRLGEAVNVYDLATYYAPEYYAHTNSVIPDRVLTVLAGEMELEHDEDIDAVLPDKVLSLLNEVREIRSDPYSLEDPDTSLDATFVALIKYCDEVMIHQKSLLCGDSGFDEEGYEVMYQAKYDSFRDHILDPENTELEKAIYQKIQAINFMRQNEDTPHFWYLPIMRADDFSGLEDDELLRRCALPPHSTFESAFSLGHRKSYYESNHDSDIAFAMMAENQITPLLRYLEMADCNDVVMASFLLLEHELYEPEFMEAVINGMGEEGERIAYLHAARDDEKMWESLPAIDQHAIMDFATLKKSLQLAYELQYREMLSPESDEYIALTESLEDSAAQMRSSIAPDSIHATQIRDFFLAQLDAATPAEAPIPEKVRSGAWYPTLVPPANSNEPLEP